MGLAGQNGPTTAGWAMGIRKGLVVKDGDTAELDPGVTSRTHFRPQGRLPGLPVLQLTLGVA
jgi:hypothetical protein